MMWHVFMLERVDSRYVIPTQTPFFMSRYGERMVSPVLVCTYLYIALLQNYESPHVMGVGFF